MSSTTTGSTKTDTSSGDASRSTDVASRSSSELQTSRGVTSIDNAVVAKIASIAAREVDGVYRLGGTVSGTLANVVGRIRGDEHATGGVGVEVGERQAAVDLTMVAEYPASIHQVAQSVRDNVTDRVESMTGLEVVEVNIAVTDLHFPGQQDESESQEPSRVQ